MAITAKIDVKENDILGSLRGFFKDILELEDIHAILVPQHLPMKNMVMPTLVTDPDHLTGVDPLAPAFAMNTAKIVSRLTRKPMGGKIAAVLRPCEIRAFIELLKLKQGRPDDIILIGIDCLGAFQNQDYFQYAGQSGAESTMRFFNAFLNGETTEMEGINLSAACKASEYPVAASADIQIGLFGVEIDAHYLVQSQTDAGTNILNQLDLAEIAEPATRRKAIRLLVERRTQYRDDMFSQTREDADSLEKMTNYFATCVNCYNCRVACPVCYCKECVFVTDVFNHDPSQYLRWANRKGIIKMPTDTFFFTLPGWLI